MIVSGGQNCTGSITQQVPSALLFFGVIMIQVVTSHPRSGQYMVLAPIDNIQADSQSLHHGRAHAAQVMRRPVAVLAVGKDQRVVMAPS